MLKDKDQGIKRRPFLKGIGTALAACYLPRIAFGADSPAAHTAGESQHQVITANIRVALPEDETGGNGWKDRRALCIDVLRNHKPDILCLQEVLRVQNEDLKKAFPDFFSFGFEGPEMDAFQDGYHGIAKNPIFFSKKRYDLLACGQYWLSETPLIGGSLSWGTARARHANWVRLKDKKSGKDFRVVNLHLDHVSQEARLQQTNVVLTEARQYAASYPQILTGDFNSAAANKVHKAITSDNWTDTYTSINGPAEPGFTIHGFDIKKATEKGLGHKIDFIYSRGPVSTTKSEIIKDQKDGKYPSDHYFVSAALTI